MWCIAGTYTLAPLRRALWVIKGTSWVGHLTYSDAPTAQNLGIPELLRGIILKSKQYWNSIFLHKFIEQLVFPSLSSEALKAKTRVKQSTYPEDSHSVMESSSFLYKLGLWVGEKMENWEFEMSFLINTCTDIWIHSHVLVDSHLFIHSFINSFSRYLLHLLCIWPCFRHR